MVERKETHSEVLLRLKQKTKYSAKNQSFLRQEKKSEKLFFLLSETIALANPFSFRSSHRCVVDTKCTVFA